MKRAKKKATKKKKSTRDARSFLWVTDPWDTLDHAKDTTLRLIEEGLRMGIRNFWCDGRSLRWEGDRVVGDVQEVLSTGKARASAEISLSPLAPRSPDEFSHIFYRTDPPVDAAYIYPLQLLELGTRDTKTRILSPVPILLSSNEKTEFFPLRDLVPAAVVSSKTETLIRFLQEQGRAVLKPLNSAQSKGVRVLEASKLEEALPAIGEATQGNEVPVILQEYLAGIAQGEVRLWFCAGKLVGKARKVPRQGEAVIDMDRGGKVVSTELNAAEKRAVTKIGRYLREREILWAAVDLIEGKITDFNFTSPGLLLQLEQLSGKNLARVLLNAVP